MEPAFRAGVALARLDEGIACSPVGHGRVERQIFGDASASLWFDSELVHLEDLVLHDATRDIRTPHPRTHRCPRRVAHPPADCCIVTGLGVIARLYPNVATEPGVEGTIRRP